MSLAIRVDGNGELEITSGGAVTLRGGEVMFGREEEALLASPWEASEIPDTRGARSLFSRQLRDSAGDAARVAVQQTGEVAWISVRAERAFSGLATLDSFEASSLLAPAFRVASGQRAFLVTHGLGRSGEGEIGGYWPEAACVRTELLPARAFTPLVIFDEESALAIAPASHFLTSSLLRNEGGFARGLHGSVDAVPAGMCLETVVAAGRDIAEALDRLGNALLARSGKERPRASASVLTSRLGWWNAYGGFYTEPIRPLDARQLHNAIDSLRAAGLPVSYVGLDLWYPYRVIGQALRFAPDRDKYPLGFAELARSRKLSFVFHLSALARGNDYAASGADPSFYTEVARELRAQAGGAAWHDWLRTQQHLTPALRSDPDAAERWFVGMARALDREGLALLLCMQTMGMVLASTALSSAIAARTAIDYLFGQPEALETLASLGHAGFKNDAISLGALRRQNLLVGSVLHSLGLLPFHDLFLTRRHDGLGGADPASEAALRAFSCGPVGLGDGPGMTDAALVARLTSARGELLHPDRAPRPTMDTLGGDVEVFRTACAAGEERWEYIAALNSRARAASFSLPHDRESTVVWDVLARRVAARMETTLEPGRMAFYALAPLRGGVAPIGLAEKFVPVPAGVVGIAEARAGKWRIELDAPGERFSFACQDAPRVQAKDGRTLTARGEEGLWTVEIPESTRQLVVTRR